MKKLYFTSILILGFLAFVPQVNSADSLPSATIQKLKQTKALQTKEQAEQNKQKNLLCLLDKKLKLSAKYKGSNLKLQTISIKKTNLEKTTFKYFLVDENTTAENLVYEYSQTIGCKEYIVIGPSWEENNAYYVYDVTNVPPNSYLQYIPKKSEMKVLPPTDKENKNIVEKQIEEIKQTM